MRAQGFILVGFFEVLDYWVWALSLGFMVKCFEVKDCVFFF